MHYLAWLFDNLIYYLSIFVVHKSRPWFQFIINLCWKESICGDRHSHVQMGVYSSLIKFTLVTLYAEKCKLEFIHILCTLLALAASVSLSDQIVVFKQKNSNYLKISSVALTFKKGHMTESNIKFIYGHINHCDVNSIVHICRQN